MKKFTIISSVVALLLSLLAIRDYNNYFKGRSFINYHVLPYGLTPYYWKDYTLENGNRVLVKNDFYFITGCEEFVGAGCPIPMNSPSTFTIDTIKCYYYNKDSIYVYCVDEEHNPHWIIPVYDEGWVVFDEIKNVNTENLSTYKCVSIFYDEK